MDSQKVMVKIVAKQKGCMLCDHAIAILEEIAPEFEKRKFSNGRWSISVPERV